MNKAKNTDSPNHAVQITLSEDNPLPRQGFDLHTKTYKEEWQAVEAGRQLLADTLAELEDAVNA